MHRERIIDSAYFVLAATASDVSAAANSETAVTDCQAAVDSLCLDGDGMRLIRHVFSRERLMYSGCFKKSSPPPKKKRLRIFSLRLNLFA